MGTLFVGLDFGEEYVQLSCISGKNMQPESLCVIPDSNRYRIPTVLYVKKETKEWLFGEDAYRYRNLKESGYVDGLLEKARTGQDTVVYESVFTPEALLEKFLRKLLSIVKQRYGNELIQKLVITQKEPDAVLSKALLGALGALGIMEDRAKIIDYLQSFMYYMISQNKELWSKDAALFHYDTEQMLFYRLSFARKNRPVVVVAEKIDLCREFMHPIPDDPEELGRLAHKLEDISDTLLHQQIISVIYVTGCGFDSNWADQVMKDWCVGRRVFRGQNLYTKGACHAASLLAEGRKDEYQFLDHTMIMSTIGLKVYHDSTEEQYVMAEAGTPWQQVESTVTVILDHTSELCFVIRNLMQKELRYADFSLDGLQKRENKTIRLSVTIRFLDRDRAVVTVRDLGFGSFYPTNYRIWEHTFYV